MAWARFPGRRSWVAGVATLCLAAPGFAAGSARAGATGGVAPAPVVEVDDGQRFQPVLGVGAAVTNSSAFLIEHALSPAARSGLLTQLFSPRRDGLSFVRVTIGGSDFNAGGIRYSEDDLPPGRVDPRLRHFSLRHDADTIAVLRRARGLDPALHVLASPWSAPAWMKSNHSLENVGLRGHLDPRYLSTYAAYLVRFVQGYARAGVPIWGLTVANEPFGVPATYEGMSITAQTEARLIRSYLRPALRRARLHTRVLVLDASWDGGPYGRQVLGSGAEADGIAWHCYRGNPDTTMPAFAGTFQVLSECAPNLIRGFVGGILAEVFNDGASAAALWNVALDPSGGPVVMPNQNCGGCTGLVTIDPATGRVAQNADLAALRSFGHLLRPGAVRIGLTRLGHFDSGASGHVTPGLHAVAFADPGGTDVVVAANDGAGTASLVIRWRSTSRTLEVPPYGTASLGWRRVLPPRRRQA